MWFFLTSPQEIPGLRGVGESLTAQGHSPTPDPGRCLQIPSPRRCPDLSVILCSSIKPNPPSLGSSVSPLCSDFIPLAWFVSSNCEHLLLLAMPKLFRNFYTL